MRSYQFQKKNLPVWRSLRILASAHAGVDALLDVAKSARPEVCAPILGILADLAKRRKVSVWRACVP